MSKFRKRVLKNGEWLTIEPGRDWLYKAVHKNVPRLPRFWNIHPVRNLDITFLFLLIC